MGPQHRKGIRNRWAEQRGEAAARRAESAPPSFELQQRERGLDVSGARTPGRGRSESVPGWGAGAGLEREFRGDEDVEGVQLRAPGTPAARPSLAGAPLPLPLAEPAPRRVSPGAPQQAHEEEQAQSGRASARGALEGNRVK